MKLSDQLRKAINDSGFTRYAIAKATGIDQSALCKFMNGERGVSVEAMDKLGKHLGLMLVLKRRKRKD